MRKLLMAAAAVVAVSSGAAAERTAAPEGAEVYIVTPADGATVSNPITVVFGARSIGVAPAGVEWEKTGHHHLLINTTADDVALDESLPATDRIRHFGGGQTEVTVELPAGTHTLQLLMGDHNHIPHDPPIFSQPITVTVP